MVPPFAINKKYRFTFFLCVLCSIVTAQIRDNASETFATARLQQQAVLLIFSGSDWCQPCIRFNKTILSDTPFTRFARQHLIVLTADFPQRKKLPAELVAQNEALAAQYNPEGAFPKILLLNPDQSVLTTLSYNNQSVVQFTRQISDYLYKANMMKEYSIQTRLMGSDFEFIVVANNKNTADHWLNGCIRETRRIENLLTEFNETSQTAIINKNAGIKPVVVHKEVYDLINRSILISRLCEGAFDITASALKRLYNFKGDAFLLPSKKIIEEAVTKTGYDKIKLLPGNNVFLPVEGMRIGFGAIGKGYAADNVKTLLQDGGIASGVVNASGDLTAWGTRPNGEPWKTGIADPDKPGDIIVWLPVNEISIATSGNYIQYFDVNGKRYSHNIDPKTGYPVVGIKSVSVIGPSAELSDSLATAVTILGVKKGLQFINQLPSTHCLVIDDRNAVHHSKNLNIKTYG